MRLLATPLACTLAAAVSLTSTLPAQTFSDPANLRGERPTARDGRELPIDGGESNSALGLAQMLRRLSTRASILNIVAHPDDEDGGMLTLYARGLGARVADLSLTRGEGGQNAMTGDFEDALGLLRTQELLANDRYTGVTQMFGTEVDFGFSKTKAETFAKWTHDRCLYDAVRAIRLYRPLIITSTWTGGVTDGHGQHQVSGEIAQEAFVAAGDPTVFPELTAEGIYPWQPLKMYARVPQQAISDKGLYDYATNQYVPAKFTNYITGITSTTPPSTDAIVHEGTQDPLLTRSAARAADLPPADASLDPDTPFSYIQFARIGLGLQKSQIGPGFRVPTPGAKFDVPYHLYGSKLPLCSPDTCPPSRSAQREAEGPASLPPTVNRALLSAADASFFDGIDTSVLSIADLDEKDFPTDLLSNVARAIASANRQFDPAHPSDIAPQLSVALQNIDRLLADVGASHNGTPQQHASAMHELAVKHVQLAQALTLALGLEITAHTSTDTLPVNRPAEAQVSLTESSPESVLISGTMSENSAGRGISAAAADEENDAPQLARNHPLDTSCGLDATLATHLTRPYFYRDSIEAPVYHLSDAALRNAPASPPALTCHILITYKTSVLDLAAVATHDTQPAAFVPPATLAISQHAQVVPNIDDRIAFTMYESAAPGEIVARHDGAPTAWQSLPISNAADCTGCVAISYRIPHEDRRPLTLRPSLQLRDGTVVTEGYRPVGYGDLPRTNYYTAATDRVLPMDLNFPASIPRFPANPTAHERIGYLPGTGDDVPQALHSLGLYTRTLAISDLTPAGLAGFDVVILGVRTYEAHPELHGAPTQALLDFARHGGNVLVQYQGPTFTAADAPYPLSLGDNEKVVDETAPVHLLAPDSRLMTAPNRITTADFNGWIEERGHGFLSTWDPHYTALTETHDPGAPTEDIAPQTPQRGGLITTPLGRGRWTYCAFALYRQLPEAVPGAYRLFLDLIAP